MSSLPSSHASSCQSIRVDGIVQSGPQSNPGLREDKAGDSVKGSEQVAQEKPPAQSLVPL